MDRVAQYCVTGAAHYINAVHRMVGNDIARTGRCASDHVGVAGPLKCNSLAITHGGRSVDPHANVIALHDVAVGVLPESDAVALAGQG